MESEIRALYMFVENHIKQYKLKTQKDDFRIICWQNNKGLEIQALHTLHSSLNMVDLSQAGEIYITEDKLSYVIPNRELEKLNNKKGIVTNRADTETWQHIEWTDPQMLQKLESWIKQMHLIVTHIIRSHNLNYENHKR